MFVDVVVHVSGHVCVLFHFILLLLIYRYLLMFALH